MKLYYHHDINTIKFDPYNGEFLAGGSRSGQLVLWSVETEFDKLRHKTSVEEQDIIAEFMVSFLFLFLCLSQPIIIFYLIFIVFEKIQRRLVQFLICNRQRKLDTRAYTRFRE